MLIRCMWCVLTLGATAMGDVTLLGVVATPGNATDKSGLTGELGPGTPANVLGAHGSGIAWTGRGQTYLMAADRGPSDGATPFRCRWQTIELGMYEDGAPSAAPVCDATMLLSDERGRAFVGAAAAVEAGEGASSLRLDPEAIRVGPDGTVYVSDEYGPSVLAFSPQGKLLRRLAVPDKFLCKHPSADWEDELPPKNTVGRQPNRGFEGLAISPAGDKLYALAQGPLLQDGALDGQGKPVGTNVRILELVADGAPGREFLVQLSAPGLNLNEMVAVNDHQFLAIERDDAAGELAKVKRIVSIDIAGATDISGLAALPSTGTPDGIKPVVRATVIDLLNPRFGLNDDRMPAKIEGLAFGPDLPDGRHVLVITSDNDAKVDEPTWFWYFGLGAKDLPEFAAQKFAPK